MLNLKILDDQSFIGEKVPLNKNEVHLWLFSKKSISSDLGSFYKKLSPQERGHLLDLTQGEAKSFIIRHGLLRSLLERYLDQKSIQLDVTLKHKPFLRNSELQFNSSSSGDYFVFGFSKDMRIGIDVEVIRPLLFYEEIVEDYFSSEERAYIRENDGLRRFFEIWTCKEAMIKATGGGITDDFAKIVSKHNDDLWFLVKNPLLKKPCWLCSLKKWENICLAVALT